MQPCLDIARWRCVPPGACTVDSDARDERKDQALSTSKRGLAVAVHCSSVVRAMPQPESAG